MNATYTWIALAIAGLVTALCIANIGYGAGVLRLVFPIACAIIGLALYFRSATCYLAFTFVIWFISPLVRRLIDLYAGWLDPSPVLLAPLVVTLISGISVVSLFTLDREVSYPYILATAGILFGLGVGLLRSGAIAVVVPLLNFLAPVLLGAYILSNWRRCRALTVTFDRTVTFGVLIMGIYGIVQYLFAPAWDTYWLLNVDSAAAPAFGTPEPFGIRVFGTLNSPAPFGIVIMVGLLILANRRGWTVNVVLLIGYLALGLSLARTAWLGWAAGALFLALFTRRSRWTLISSFAIFVLVALAATSFSSIDAITNVISKRAQTLAAPKEDFSLNVRIAAYEEDVIALLTDPVGDGIASQGTAVEARAGFGPHDSAVLELFRCLGWLGGGMYLLGVGALIYRALIPPISSVPALQAYRAIACGLIPAALFVSVFLSVSGAVFWAVLSFASAHRLQSEATMAS